VHIVWFDGSGVDPATYPADQRPAVWASDVVLDDQSRPSFTLNTPDGSARCTMQLRGMHNVHNACAAAAVGSAAGMEAPTIAAALAAALPMTGRQHVSRTAAGITVIDDAYNANPDSMRASLAMFTAMEISGRRIAVLGDMGELGEHATALHEEVGRTAARCDLDHLICIGTLARGIAAGARAAGMAADAIDTVDDVPTVLDILDEELNEGDAVLVKASHSMGLERVVEGLVD
jgi:UDP-N-acetylmuramoyl-tripeptide--D-alanyl-D-alanine ligase